MERYRIKCAFYASLLLCLSCTHKSQQAATPGNYPADIAAIFLNKCALSGCHNNLSNLNADELNLTTWDDLFKGGSNGAVIVPYRPDFSSLCFFTNTYSDLGIALQPTMPYNGTPLTRTEYLRLRDWITAGAPEGDGHVKFADDPARKKFYITNQQCNVVTVIDDSALLQMRYVDVGDGATAKFPYCIKVSPDKKYWYVSFFSPTGFVQKFDASNDHLVGQVSLGTGNWTSFSIAADSRHAWFVDNSSPGKVVYADLDKMTVLATYDYAGNLAYPTGIAADEKLKKLYVGTLNGNYVYEIDITDPMSPIIQELPIDGSSVVQLQSSINPVELLADTLNDRCYMACVATHEIRVVDMVHDSLVAVIALGSAPAFMALAGNAKKLFISCPDDFATYPGNRGSVAIAELASYTVVKRVNTGYQPYGLAVDDDQTVVAVVNANVASGGPASHHVSGCGKKNGNLTFIDLNTLDLVPHKLLELAVYPFAAATR